MLRTTKKEWYIMILNNTKNLKKIYTKLGYWSHPMVYIKVGQRQ